MTWLLRVPLSPRRGDHGEFHVRGNGDNLENRRARPRFPARGRRRRAESCSRLSTSLQITFDGKAGLLEGRPLLTKETEGNLTSFKIEDALTTSMARWMGPTRSIAKVTFPSEFKTRLEKLDLWEKHLLKLFPEARSTISGMAALLQGLAKGEDKVTVNLVVDEGTISLRRCSRWARHSGPI